MTENKPPRPVSFGNKAENIVGESDHDKNKGRNESFSSLGENSTDSRVVLRQEIRKRRMSLTPQEFGFLEELITHGNEVELTVAHRNLCDDEVFFDKEESNHETDISALSTNSDQENNKPGEELNDVSVEDMKHILETSQRLRSGSETLTLGSAKRQEHLQQRRQSTLYGNLWKAHEHGIVMTRSRPRSKSIACLREERSIGGRRSSFMSVETANLLSNGGPLLREGEDAIFRRTEEDVVFRKPAIPPKQRLSASAQNHGRKVSWSGPSTSAATRPKRPILRRYDSEGERKSVSFAEYDDEGGDHPTRLPGIPRKVTRKRNVSTDTEVSALETDLGGDEVERSESVSSIPSLHHGRPIRSDSVSSIHSIHHARPIRSDSVTSVSSIPSLHHPHPVREDSMSSVHSIHHANRIDSGTNLPNYDYDAQSLGASTIPSLHHGRPLRTESESLVSFRSSVSSPEKESREPAWTDPLVKAANEMQEKPQLLRHPSQQAMQRPVLMRRASRNVYNGEGIEVEELPPEVDFDSISKARKYKSMLSFGDTAIGSVLTSTSFDQSMTRDTINRDSIFRDLKRSLSDEGRSMFFLGSLSPLSPRSSHLSVDTLHPEDEEEDDRSWDMQDDSPKGHFDAWDVFVEDPSYGNVPTFKVLGTSADDEASTPHVLSPPLMDSLRNFFPYSLTESNFWMKYSLLRDGSSFHSLLQNIRGATFTIIAIETVDGEVFGSFTSEPWRKNWKYFGTGESFLWRMRQSRATPCFDVFDQAKMESELDVYPWTGDNDCIQLCTHDKLAVGGGSRGVDEKKADDASTTEYGFGLAIEKELLYGTSTRCATFGSPPLSTEHSDGSPFEIVNLEVWALTPCDTLEDAEKLELGQLFLRTS